MYEKKPIKSMPDIAKIIDTGIVNNNNSRAGTDEFSDWATCFSI